MRVAASLLTTGLLIAGCAQKPLPTALAPTTPNPFGYMKQSAVCTVSPLKQGRVVMSTRSDDGHCEFPVEQADSTAYASFLLQTLPAHGKAFIYNYNNQTLVSYTATTAYAGPDSFSVSLVPAAGRPRVPLQVVVSIDATGVPLPVAPPPPAAAPPASSHKSVVHKKTHARAATSS